MFWSGEIVCQKGNVGAVCDAVPPPRPGSWDLLQTVEEVLINLSEWRPTGEQALSCSEQELIHKNQGKRPDGLLCCEWKLP